jgi:PPOX class probable F420-dependent enzyme
MIGTVEQDAFVSRSMAAIITTVRADGSPAASMIGYARVGDRLYFSTTVDRLKGRTLTRDPRSVVTVINDNEPSSFVSVEGTVTIHRDNPMVLREQMYDAWDLLRATHPKSFWARGGRAASDPMFSQPGRAIFEVTPTRVSGVIL